MVVCQHHLRGACRFGARCINEHVDPAAAAAPSSPAKETTYMPEELLAQELRQTERPLWIFSSFGPVKDIPSCFGADVSPEELRYRYQMAAAANDGSLYPEQQLMQQAQTTLAQATGNISSLARTVRDMQATAAGGRIAPSRAAPGSSAFAAAPKSAFGGQPAQPAGAFPQSSTSAFGQARTSAFGQAAASAFGSPARSQQGSAFGASGFGQPAGKSAFASAATSPPSAFSAMSGATSWSAQPAAPAPNAFAAAATAAGPSWATRSQPGTSSLAQSSAPGSSSFGSSGLADVWGPEMTADGALDEAARQAYAGNDFTWSQIAQLQVPPPLSMR